MIHARVRAQATAIRVVRSREALGADHPPLHQVAEARDSPIRYAIMYPICQIMILNPRKGATSRSTTDHASGPAGGRTPPGLGDLPKPVCENARSLCMTLPKSPPAQLPPPAQHHRAADPTVRQPQRDHDRLASCGRQVLDFGGRSRPQLFGGGTQHTAGAQKLTPKLHRAPLPSPD
jgi:hypothetical protein